MKTTETVSFYYLKPLFVASRKFHVFSTDLQPKELDFVGSNRLEIHWFNREFLAKRRCWQINFPVKSEFFNGIRRFPFDFHLFHLFYEKNKRKLVES